MTQNYQAFKQAIILNDQVKIESFLKEGYKSSYGLSIAVAENNLPLTEYLLKKGAKAVHGVQQAIINNNITILKTLLKTLLIEEIDKKTLANFLSSAVTQQNIIIVKLLIEEYKVDPSYGLDSAINNDSKEILNYLLIKNIDANLGLQAVIKKNNIILLDKLLDKNAEPNKGLNIAITEKNYDILKYLLEIKGAIASHGLNHAIWLEDIEAIDILFEFGADANVAIESAVTKKSLVIINKLIEHDVKLEEVIEEAKRRNFDELVENILKQTDDLTDTLFNAIEDAKLETVKLLIGNGADATLGFFKAIKTLNAPIIDFLYDNIKNVAKAVRVAAKNQELEALKFFLDKGVKFDGTLIGAYGFKPGITDSIRHNLNNCYLFSLNDKHLRDLDLIKHFHGLMIAGERYKHFSTKEFSLDNDKLVDAQSLFQDLINFASNRNIPLMAISGAFQQLALQQGSTIEHLKNYSNSNKHVANFNSDNFAYFLTLSNTEQVTAMSKCILPKISIENIYTTHSYTIKLETISPYAKISAFSEDQIVQAISFSPQLIGYQFHPEEHYNNSPREKNIIDNFIKLITQRHKAYNYAAKYKINSAKIKALIDFAENQISLRLEKCLIDDSDELPPLTNLLSSDYWVELIKNEDIFINYNI
jgi:gamma-glutamyl-gamma-aminobutyrate hydrolase PuuD